MKPTDEMVEAAVELSHLLEIDFDGDDPFVRQDSVDTFVRAILEAALSRHPEGVKAVGDFDPLAEARALAERAGIDMLEEQDLFIADLTETLQRTLSSLETEQGEKAVALRVANCVRCGRIVDTRETSDGGDAFGCELEKGKWACSAECWEAIVDPSPPASQPSDREGWRDIKSGGGNDAE